MSLSTIQIYTIIIFKCVIQRRTIRSLNVRDFRFTIRYFSEQKQFLCCLILQIGILIIKNNWIIANSCTINCTLRTANESSRAHSNKISFLLQNMIRAFQEHTHGFYFFYIKVQYSLLKNIAIVPVQENSQAPVTT